MRSAGRRARLALAVAAASLVVGVSACTDIARPATGLEILTAGVLALPLRAAADSFTALNALPAARLEAAGSLEVVRRVTELHRTPDILAVADAELIPRLVMPAHGSWYAVIARDRMVLAYTPLSRGAAVVNDANWRSVVTDDGVVIGRSDPDRDPAGYRALLTMKLVARQAGEPALAARLLAHSPASAMRPRSGELVALLQAGELDYAWLYESVAATAGLGFVRLPPSADLGDPSWTEAYAAESVWVAGTGHGDTIAMTGRPIQLALTIPEGAPHGAEAARFVAWLLGDDGRRVLAGAGLELLPIPRLSGRDVPPPVLGAVELRP